MSDAAETLSRLAARIAEPGEMVDRADSSANLVRILGHDLADVRQGGARLTSELVLAELGNDLSGRAAWTVQGYPRGTESLKLSIEHGRVGNEWCEFPDSVPVAGGK